MSFAKNYKIDFLDWKPLSDIMNQDYETTLDYIIHVNDISTGVLQFTYRVETPAKTDKGREVPAFTEIAVAKDTGDHIYIKTSGNSIDIEIRQA